MTLTLHPDRLLPADPGERAIARRLYEAVRELPVISPHGHVDPRVLLEDEPFPDPATLLITPDHYVTRLLHADALQPLLERFGTHPNLHLIVFTVDETVWSRELAPLAGFYPSVCVGVPWWFLDAPDAIRRFRGAVTETAGFSRTSGFVDDTRAFWSIPARHDMSRRIDAGVLARLVAEHRLEEDEATETAVELVTRQPTTAFKL
jgi:glucuronate isomerase